MTSDKKPRAFGAPNSDAEESGEDGDSDSKSSSEDSEGDAKDEVREDESQVPVDEKRKPKLQKGMTHKDVAESVPADMTRL